MAKPNIPVKVVEVCRVAPKPTSPSSPTSLPLTFFDLRWLRFPPTQRLYFYEVPNPTLLQEIVLPKLKHSLSLTLQHYLPLAGNLRWPPDSDEPFLQYSDGDGVSLTIAESEADFHHLSSNDFTHVKELHPFLPSLPATDAQVPAMTLQVTLFPKAGFSIGIAAHHAVADGKTSTTFMRGWASICKKGGGESEKSSNLTPELTPSYCRNLVQDEAGIRTSYLKSWMEMNGPNNNSRTLNIWEMKPSPDAMIGTFILTPSRIEELKKWVRSRLEDKYKETKKPAIHLSTFTLMSAYVWVCLVKARKMKTEKVTLAFSVDCRARLEPPLPSTYFGNCISGCFTEAPTKDLMEDEGLVVAAELIGERLKGMIESGVVKGAETSMSSLASLQLESLFSIAGSPRFEQYSADFGWGRPIKVEMTSIDKTGAFSLSESRDGSGGLEIGIVLSKDETLDFSSLFAAA